MKGKFDLRLSNLASIEKSKIYHARNKVELIVVSGEIEVRLCKVVGQHFAKYQVSKIMSQRQSTEELEGHLKEQLQFLMTSANLYDKGNKSEAKRLAVTIRLLLHDTRDSISLLSQLGYKDKLFLDTSNYEVYKKTPWDVLVYTGLIGTSLVPYENKIEFIPILVPREDNSIQWREFELWWKMVVIKDTLGTTFSRRDLILNMANKDGGAHVDPVIKLEYAALTRQNSLGVTGQVGKFQQPRPIPHPEKAAVRQIAHEVLSSLIPNYKREIWRKKQSAVISNVMMFKEPLVFDPIGKCPCGSNENYFDCHGQTG